MTLTEAFKTYTLHEIYNEGYKEKTFKNYRCAVNSFIRQHGDIDVENIEIEHIWSWKLSMQQNGRTQTYIGNQTQKIRSMLKFLCTMGANVLDPNKIKSVRADTKPRPLVEPDVIRKVVDATKNKRDKAIICGLFNTGARVSELLNIDRDNFEGMKRVDGVYEIWVCGKGDKYRPLYFDPRTKSVIDAYLATRNDTFHPLFVSGQNNRITISRVEQIIHQAACAAGIEVRITPHILRHAFISDMLINKAPVKNVQEIAGHALASTTLNIYAHVLPTHNRKAHTEFHTVV